MKRHLKLTLLLLLFLTGCMTPAGDGTIDGVDEAFTGRAAPDTVPAEVVEGRGLPAKRIPRLQYVEGYIEYPGPQAKWAGPPSLMIHIIAKDPGSARLQVTPQLFEPSTKDQVTPNRVKRILASESLSSQSARDQLRKLGESMEGVDPIYNGCLYPVRVRLVRTDGSVFEKQGCRGRVGWPRVASESADYFLTGVLLGASN